MDAISNAVSGLRAAQLQVDVASNNVANMNTAGFQPSVVDQAAQTGGGVAASVRLAQAPPIIPGASPEDQPSGTDLLAEMATLVTAPITYAANARVIDASNQQMRSLLDLFA
jgi:flagellar hook protein FlgE